VDRIIVLSRSRTYTGTRLIQAAARRRGIETVVCDPDSVTVDMTSDGKDGVQLRFHGDPIPLARAVIPRMGSMASEHALRVLEAFEVAGMHVINPAASVRLCGDKFHCALTLQRNGIPVPRTVLLHDSWSVENSLEEVGGLPAVLKLPSGFQGVGTVLCSDMGQLRSVAQLMSGTSPSFMLQEYLDARPGSDVRVIVAGGRHIACIRRTAAPGEFRSNLHQGGSIAREEDPSYIDLGVRVAGLVGADLCAVDIMDGRDGPVVLEVNSSPGFESPRDVLGIDLGEVILDMIPSPST